MVKFEGKLEVTKTTPGGGTRTEEEEAFGDVTRSRIILDAGEHDERSISLRIRDNHSKMIFSFYSEYRTFSLNTDKEWQAVKLQGIGDQGTISVYDKKNRNSIFMEGGTHSIFLKDDAEKDNITMDGLKGTISMRDAAGKGTIHMDGLNGNLYLTGQLIMRDAADKDSIVIDGPSGDIVLNNADCAEDFDVLHPTVIDPGTVMVIEQEGKLKECDAPYDKRVAGVISGAGDYKPGLVLDKQKSIGNRKSISLMGKVHCKVDAQSAPIDVGDLLTTSSTTGHAMKAVDPVKAFGSVIGKALRPLKAGTGLIPILIALQ